MKTTELKKKLEEIIGIPVQILATYETMPSSDCFQYLHELKIKFSYLNDDIEEVEIAIIELQLIESEFSDEMEDDDYDMWELMDDESRELSEVAENLGILNWGEDMQYTNFNVLYESHLYYIKKLEVTDGYRGKGIGSAIMESIFELVKKSTNLLADYIVFIPFPFKASEETVKQDCERLHRFYSKFGAKPANDFGRTWILEREE